MIVTFYPNYLHKTGFDKTAEPSITGQNYASSGAETTGPAYDLVDNRDDNVITIDTDAEATDWVIDIDLSSTPSESYNFAIVANHNFNTADADVVPRMGSTPANRTVSSAYSGTLGSETTEETVSSNYVLIPTDGTLLINFNAGNSAYWDLYVRDNGADNFDADCTVGEVAFGVACAMTYPTELDQLEPYQVGSQIRKSRAGQAYGFKQWGPQRIWKLNWKVMSSTDKTNLEAVFEATHGNVRPLWFDTGLGTNPILYYARFVDDVLNFKKLTHNAYSLQVLLEEVM